METVIPAIGGLTSYGAGKRTDIQSTCRKYRISEAPRGKGGGIIRVRCKPILFERIVQRVIPFPRDTYIYICMYVCTTFVLASNRISPLQLSFRERFDVVNRGTRGRARRNKNGNKKEETSEEGVNRKGRGKSHG